MMNRKIWIVIAVLLCFAGLGGYFLERILPQIPTPITMGLIFLALLAIVDRWLWSSPLFTALLLTSANNLNGVWRGRISSSFQEHSQIVPVSVQIEQRWLTTVISLKGSVSTSRSIVAGTFQMPDQSQTLAYIYYARPLSGFEHEINPHIGMCLLKINSSSQLSGFYVYFDEYDKEFVRGQLVIERGIHTSLPGDELTT